MVDSGLLGIYVKTEAFFTSYKIVGDEEKISYIDNYKSCNSWKRTTNLKLDLWNYRPVYVAGDIQIYLKGTLMLTGSLIHMRANFQVDLFLLLGSHPSRYVKQLELY